MRVACGDQINELEVSVLERDNEWRERINSSECALAVEFEHARAVAGWDAPVIIFGLTYLACFG